MESALLGTAGEVPKLRILQFPCFYRSSVDSACSEVESLRRIVGVPFCGRGTDGSLKEHGMGLIGQVEMTPASREPVSWHAVTRDPNRHRIISDMGCGC
jgi:hypothetical protein